MTVTSGQSITVKVEVSGRVPKPDRPDRVRLMVRYNPADAAYDELPERDMRRVHPRFRDGAFDANLEAVATVRDVAAAHGATPGQVALAWLLEQGPDVVPIPGTTNPAHMRENAAAAAVTLSPEIRSRVDDVVNGQTVTGARYA